MSPGDGDGFNFLTVFKSLLIPPLGLSVIKTIYNSCLPLIYVPLQKKNKKLKDFENLNLRSINSTNVPLRKGGEIKPHIYYY